MPTREAICVIAGWALLIGGLMMLWHLPGLMIGLGVLLIATFGRSTLT